MSEWDNDEPLGYGRPPKWTRFKKGQSGNPKGRPKKKVAPEPSSISEQDAILREEIDRKVKITEGGEIKEVTIQEAITKAQAAQAVKGSPFAQKEILSRIERLERAEEREEAARLEDAKADRLSKAERERNFFAYLCELKENQKKAWKQAEAEGKAEPDFPWPHPDDVMLDEGRRQYRIRGPMSAQEVPLYRLRRAERDTALARMVEAGVADTDSASGWMKAWSLIAHCHDAELPLRWQLRDGWDAQISRLLFLTDRQIRREVERRAKESEKWRSIARVEGSPKAYKITNDALWPTLDTGGYRSLAQFQEACNATDGRPPWPREPNRPERLG